MMERNLQMSLKRKWFEMTKAGIKTEDYREVTQYWLKRLFGKYLMSDGELCSNGMVYSTITQNKDIILKYNNPKQFDYNIMTLGYPSKDDHNRILKLPHAGIEIRTGNPEWGAEPGKLYFVIKHGNEEN